MRHVMIRGVATCVLLLCAARAQGNLLQFQRSFGQGQVSSPWGITVDAEGKVYVADLAAGSSIAEFDRAGNLLQRFGSGALGWAPNASAAANGSIYSLDGGKVRRFNAARASAGTFGLYSSAFGIATDSLSRVYVADVVNNQVLRWDADGNALPTIAPTGAGAFNKPYGVAVDDGGNIYVADTFNTRVEVFDADGGLLRSFSTVVPNWPDTPRPKQLAIAQNGTIYMSLGDSGFAAFSAEGALLDSYATGIGMASGIALDGDTLYGVDRGVSGDSVHNRIMVFAVPEPASMGLLACAGAGAGLLRRRR